MNNAKNNKRILLCINSDIGRGRSIGWRFFQIAKELRNEGIDFEIIARDNHSDFPVITPFYKNYLARLLRAIRIYLFPFFQPRSIDVSLFDNFVLQKIKKLGKFDIAHFGEYLPKSIYYLKERGVRIFLDIPTAHYKYLYSLGKKSFDLDNKILPEKNIDKAITLSDLLVIPSPFVKESLKMAGFGDKEMKIVNFGADMPSDFEERDILDKTKSFKENNIPMRFIHCGGVNFRKGANFLIEAWNKVNLKNAELIFCGRIYRSSKKFTKNLKKDIKLLGYADVKPYLKNSHIFILPSLMEGSAKAIFEAMSYGLPIITTFNSGSVIENNKDGYIVPIGNSDILSEKIKYFYNNPDKVAEMGISVFNKSKNYTWKRYGEDVVELYNN